MDRSLRRLTQDSTEEGRPIRSQDGKFIYFYSYRTGRMETWKIPAEGGGWVKVTSNGGHEARESPDGAYLYYSTYGKGLFRRPTAGGEDERILEKASSGWWAVTDRGVIFASFDTDAVTSPPPIPIQFWDAATRKITILGTLEKPVHRMAAGLSATRDGKVIVWSQIDSEDSDLVLVEGFR